MIHVVGIYVSRVDIMLTSWYTDDELSYAWCIFMYTVLGYIWWVDIRVDHIYVSCVGIILVVWYTGCGYVCILCLYNGGWLEYG